MLIVANFLGDVSTRMHHRHTNNDDEGKTKNIFSCDFKETMQRINNYC